MTSGSATTDYLFDGTEVISSKKGTNNPVYYTRRLGDQLISRRAGTNAPTYYHNDAIGSVVALTNNTSDLTDTHSYTSYGEVRERTSQVTTFEQSHLSPIPRRRIR